MRWVGGLALIAGCGDPGGTDGGGDDVAPPDTDEPADTDTTPIDTDPPDTDTPPPPDETITAVCSPLGNALRSSCLVTVDPPQPVQVTYSKTDGTGPARTLTSDLVQGDHEIVVYFLEPDTDYTLTAAATAAPDDLTVTTSLLSGIPPVGVRSSLVVDGVSSVPMIGTHNPCNSDATGVIYSTETGRLLWYQTLDASGVLGFLDMIQFTEDHTVLGETGPAVVEVDLLGQELFRLDNGSDYDVYLHHDIFKRDGLYYLLYQENFGPGTPLLDSFLVVDALGTQLAQWRSVDQLAIPGSATGDWMHTNTIYVDDGGDVFLSLLGQDSVLRIEATDLLDPDWGAHTWTLAGSLGGFGLGQDFVVDWDLVDGDDGFGDQHSALIRNDGRLMFLDNDNGRGLVISLDETLMTATVDEAWETVEPGCGPQGTARDSLAGNSFVGCSGENFREYSPSAGLVWSAEVNCGGGFISVARFYPLEGW
jgi:hypothetical protein